MAEELCRMSASELAARMRAREVSPVEVAQACLDRVERDNGELNAICTVSERAMDEARRAEATIMRGDPPPLCGVPFGIKDITPTAGLRTTFGSPLYRDHVPTEDALVVARLKRAGGVMIGKTNTPEFAAGGNTFNEVFGVTRNPWDRTKSAGGSTGGGAAALAAGMIALAEGTDLGGSLRIPASFCGVVGLRPSPGLVPTLPSDYYWDSLSVTGPMGRTVQDVALMLQTMVGQGAFTPLFQPTAGRDFVKAALGGLGATSRLAYSTEVAGIGMDPGIDAICWKAARELAQEGCSVDHVEFDLAFSRDAFLTLRGLWMVVHQFSRLDRIDTLGANVAGNVRAGLKVSSQQLAAAEHARNRLWRKFHDFFTEYDCLLTPCMAVPPFPAEMNYPQEVGGRKMNTYVDWIAPTFVLSLSGLPVACVPCGRDANGLPVGMQVVGPPRGEELALAVAHQIQLANRIGLPPR